MRIRLYGFARLHCAGRQQANRQSSPNALGDIATTTNPDPAIQQLKAIWNDANWQGILALDFPVADMPDILEALRG